MLKYDTILWDLDGTLLDFKKTERYALSVCLKSYGVTMTEEMLSVYSGINEALWEKLERGEIEKRELLPGRFREFFRQMGIQGIDPNEMRKQFERELGTKTYYVDHSREIVIKLKEMGIRQHIVTNGTLATQRIKLRNSGFDSLVDKVFISDVIGYDKPRKEFFEIAFGKLPDFERGKALLVGDSLTSDMRGANNVGIDACWYNPGRKPLPEQSGEESPVHVEYEIGNLWDVLEILRGEYAKIRKTETEITIPFKNPYGADG